ncbi:MAG: OmpA family protein [Pseudomonadota bacterium]
MRKLVTGIIVLSLSVSSQAFAGKASKEENIGVGTGAVVGALAGGPVGFVIGAAVGAKLGDNAHKKNTEIETLASSLDRSQDRAATLSADLDAVSNELERVENFARPDLVNMLEAGIAMDLLFRTDEFVLADTTGSRLATLAGVLAGMPDVQIQLDGYADERGNDAYNQTLSEKRVGFVREQLIAAGIADSRIQYSAHGEVPAQEQNVDSYALERRVSLTLFIDDSQSFARTPN